MSQNDLVIANQTFPATRADINSALQSLGSLNSGPSAPATTYANMMWYDTLANILYMRSEADDAWITLGTLDQSLNTFNPAGIATQTTAVWEAGTDTTESLVSAAKVAAAIGAAKISGDAIARVEDLPVLTITAASTYDIGPFVADGTRAGSVLSGNTQICFFTCVRITGSIRFSNSIGAADGTGTATIQALVNGIEVYTRSTTNVIGSAINVDISVSDGDTVEWRSSCTVGRARGQVNSSTADNTYAEVSPLSQIINI